jgi:hypothetical protein
MGLMRRRILLGDSYLGLSGGAVRSRFALIEGRRGTGKTRGILSILLARALRNPGSRWLLARSTRTRLSETVLTTFEQQVFPAFGMDVPGGAGVENRHRYDLPNGSVFLPMGLDDPQRGQSLEVAGIYVAEGVEIPKLDQVAALAGAMRQAPRPDWDPSFFYQCLVDCNPGPPGHWLNQVAEDVPKAWRHVQNIADYRRLLAFGLQRPAPGKWPRIITQHMDNPAYFDAETWTWTKAGLTYLETLGHLSGHLRRRWLDGLWVAAEGSVYPEFDEDVHVVEPFNVPQDWPFFVGVDPGYDHPCAILWFSIAPNGCMYVVHELYRGGLSIAQHAADIRVSNGAGWTVHRYYGDPQHCFSQTAQSPKSIAGQFREHGISVLPWPRSTDEESMVERVRERLRTVRFKVFRTCRNTINEFQSWSYKRDAKGMMPKGDDQFEDANNHAMDVIKGLVALNLTYDRNTIQVYHNAGET